MDKDKLKSILTMAARSAHWDEFGVACQFASISKSQAIREAMWQWMNKHQKDIDALYRKYDFVRKKRPSFYDVFKALCIELEVSESKGIKMAMRDWLDKVRR